MIFGRQVNWVHVLDFAGLTKEMGETLTDRMRMVYTGEEGQVLFTSHAWRRLFEFQGPLVREFILEFFSTYRMRRKSRAWLSGGYFIGRLAAHFGLVSDEGMMRLTVITREPSMINIDELVKHNIYVRLGDSWAWVAPRPERQQVTVAGAPEDVESADAEVEGARLFWHPYMHLGHLQLLPSLGLCPRGWLSSSRRFMGFKRAWMSSARL
nr:hypothetical protein [Tanacetum cinerariifolium]